MVLSTWESPVSRAVECALPGLFRTAVEALRHDGAVDDDALETLLRRVLAQPTQRKVRTCLCVLVSVCWCAYYLQSNIHAVLACSLRL